MIGILDYGMGNLGSVRNACAFLEVPARILTSPDEIGEMDALLMPGQGAFRDCMAHLRDQGWVEPVCEWIAADKPFFGICMGLQVLFEASEESPGVEGLGVLPGTVRRFPDSSGSESAADGVEPRAMDEIGREVSAGAGRSALLFRAQLLCAPGGGGLGGRGNGLWVRVCERGVFRALSRGAVSSGKKSTGRFGVAANVCKRPFGLRVPA